MRDESLIRQLIELKEDVRKLKRFNRTANVSPAVAAIAAGSANPNHSHAEHLLVSNYFNSPLLWYGTTAQLRLQNSGNQYTQYDELGRLDFGSDPQQKQASIYARRGNAGGSGDYPSDIIFEIIPDGSSSIVTAMEILYSRRFTLNGITSIYNKTGDADILSLYDENDIRIHRFERDGDYTVTGTQNAGLQHIIQNTNTGSGAFTEWFGGVNTSNSEAISIGAAISGYSGSYYGDYSWLGGRNRNLYLFADGGGADNKAIHFATGTGPTAVTSRGNINSSGLTLSTGARINEFSTDGALAGDSDVAVPTEKAVKTYVDARTYDNWFGVKEIGWSESTGSSSETYVGGGHLGRTITPSGGTYSFTWLSIRIPGWITSTTVTFRMYYGNNGNDFTGNIIQYVSSYNVTTATDTAVSSYNVENGTTATTFNTGTVTTNMRYVEWTVTIGGTDHDMIGMALSFTSASGFVIYGIQAIFA